MSFFWANSGQEEYEVHLALNSRGVVLLLTLLSPYVAPAAHVIFQVSCYTYCIRHRYPGLIRECHDQGQFYEFLPAPPRRKANLNLDASGLKKFEVSVAPPSPLSSSAARLICGLLIRIIPRITHASGSPESRASESPMPLGLAPTRSAQPSKLKVSMMCSRRPLEPAC